MTGDRPRIDSAPRWLCLTAGVLAVFAIFHVLALALGSDRGQAGVVVGAVILAATLAVDRVCFGRSVPTAVRELGLVRPRIVGVAVAGFASVALLLLVPLYMLATGIPLTTMPGWSWLVPGLFAQAGVAEEVLFRGFLFGHLRVGRSFWRAAGLSMLPFSLAHLLMFFTMPWPIALAGLLLSIVVSFPLAHLFELGGGTIWPPALLHFVVQGAIKILVLPEAAALAFPLWWMAASAVIPWIVFLVPRRT